MGSAQSDKDSLHDRMARALALRTTPFTSGSRSAASRKQRAASKCSCRLSWSRPSRRASSAAVACWCACACVGEWTTGGVSIMHLRMRVRVYVCCHAKSNAPPPRCSGPAQRPGRRHVAGAACPTPSDARAAAPAALPTTPCPPRGPRAQRAAVCSRRARRRRRPCHAASRPASSCVGCGVEVGRINQLHKRDACVIRG